MPRSEKICSVCNAVCLPYCIVHAETVQNKSVKSADMFAALADLLSGYLSMIFQALLVSHAERGGDKLVIVITPLNAISFTHKTSFERVCVLKRTRDD